MLGFHRHKPGRRMHPEELSVAPFLFQLRGHVDLGTTLDHSRASPKSNSMPAETKMLSTGPDSSCWDPGAEQICRVCQAPSQMLLSSAASSLLQQRKPRGKTFLLQPCSTLSFEQISVWACVIGRACSSCFLRLYLKRPEEKYYGKYRGERKDLKVLCLDISYLAVKKGK